MSDSITVTRHPDGTSITPGPGHYEKLLKDVFALLDAKPTLWDDLLDLIDGEPAPLDRYRPGQPDRADALAERLVAALRPQSLSVRLNHRGAAALRDALSVAELPAQQDRRAS